MLVSAPEPMAAPWIQGPVVADVLEVVDGDTLRVRAHIWLAQTIETRVRIAGIDAPELSSPCARAQGEAARSFLSARISAAAKPSPGLSSGKPKEGRVFLHRIRPGKYGGRVVAQVRDAQGDDLAAVLLRAGLVRDYDGRGPRPEWCARN